ncbi:type VI secretion system protein ImpB [Granulicella aggregans]|uniref:Type VI secretion system protein ImpB n=1 Tax=Granulicella aggregans TaxID=474949 RepID=A0A7W7ZII6_9BACT|nr:type VI secretion system contractile sheath small subunit [Granulicella aggregans]MBB5060373.1 type VI secretion system protein ImpB [Granulicella aggregans]
MAKESTQRILSRVRPPRVQITYDVEVGEAIEQKELPFVMGVLADLTGQASEPLAPLKERKFTEITPDNFDAVLANLKPRLAFSTENVLSDDPQRGQLAVELNFESLEDFSPARLATQIEPLRQLLELRTRLADLQGSLQGNDKLDEALYAAVSDTDTREKLLQELGNHGEN